MPNDHIDVDTPKTMSPATGAGISQNITARRSIALSVEPDNKRLDPPPHLYTLSNILHNTVSAVMALLDASRPRVLHLARTVSARAIFVALAYIATFFILTTVLAVSTSIAQQTATTLQKVSGDNQKALFNTKLPNSLVVKVLDQNGAAMSGVTVSFAKTEGDGGSVTPTSATTGLNGQASTSLTLGNSNAGMNPYTYKVTASVTGLTSVVFTATGLRPTTLSSVDNSTGQSGPAGEWLPNPLVVQILGQGNVPLEGASITWVPDLTANPSADAKVSQTKTKTDAQGRSSTRLKLGSKIGRYDVRAITPDAVGTQSQFFYATATAARPVEVRIHQFRQGRGANPRIVTTQSSTEPLIVRVLDAHNEPLKGAEVNFSVKPSDGVLNPPTAITGANGQARTILTLGAAKVYTVTATVVTAGLDLSPIIFVVEKQVEKQKRIRQDCPVGWIRSDGFAGRNRRALLYEVKVEMDIHNRVSIYKPVWVAIYVHPDEGLETLDGWKLQVALPYNRHSEYLLTAENSVVVDAGFVEGGFAFIEPRQENPFPMTGMGFPGSPAPGFDYRLYDDSGRRVDFGISCYKRFDIFQVLKNTEDPRVLRKVLLESFDWDSHYLRSEWTVSTPAPAAPSQIKGNVVGTWADLKKQ